MTLVPLEDHAHALEVAKEKGSCLALAFVGALLLAAGLANWPRGHGDAVRVVRVHPLGEAPSSPEPDDDDDTPH